MANTNNTGIEREMSWDDTFENDSTYTIVPAGDYEFTVTGFERSRHNGSEKLPACNKAVLTIEITDGINTTTVTHNLFLHSRTEGMVCEFFVAIGHRKHGEALKPNWNAVVGATGRCKVSTRTYNGNEYNDIKKFYEPKGAPAAAAATFQAGAF